MPASADLPATRALAQLYSLPAQRAPLAALCCIEAEIASARASIDHQVAHARLGWWREECQRCAQGMPQHPLTIALSASLAPAAPALLQGLSGLTDTATWDLAHATFQTRSELSAYCARWSAAMLEPLVRFAAPQSSAAASLGVALRELELLLALAPEARAGRVRLPLDELARSGATAEELSQPPWPAALSALIAARHAQLRGALHAAASALPGALQAQLRGLMVWIALTCQHSQRAERALPAAAAAGDHHRLLDGWRAWRAARRATAGLGLAPG